MVPDGSIARAPALGAKRTCKLCKCKFKVTAANLEAKECKLCCPRQRRSPSTTRRAAKARHSGLAASHRNFSLNDLVHLTANAPVQPPVRNWSIDDLSRAAEAGKEIDGWTTKRIVTSPLHEPMYEPASPVSPLDLGPRTATGGVSAGC